MFLRPQSSRNLAQLRNAPMSATQLPTPAPPPAGPPGSLSGSPMGPVDQTGVAGPAPQVGYMAPLMSGMNQRMIDQMRAMRSSSGMNRLGQPSSPMNRLGQKIDPNKGMQQGMSPMRAQLMQRMLMSRMGGPMMGAQ